MSWIPQTSESMLAKLRICIWELRKEEEFHREGQGSWVDGSILREGPQLSIGLHSKQGPLRHIHINSKSSSPLPIPQFLGHPSFSGTCYKVLTEKYQNSVWSSDSTVYVICIQSYAQVCERECTCTI